MTGNPPARRWRLLEALGAVGSVALVFGAAAVLLYAVDALPAWITGEPRHVRRAASIEEVERRLRTRLVLPYYFPKTLTWPPRRIWFTLGPPGAAAIAVDGREGGPGLFLAETLGPGGIPPRLVPEAQVLHRSPVTVGAAQGVLSRIIEDGSVGWELRWEQDGRTLLLRSRGTVDELLRIGRSAREAP